MSNYDIDTLENLVKLFFKEKLCSLEKQYVKNMTWNIQEKFLSRTIHSTLYKQYPCKQKFCGMFFKKLIELLEPEQEVHDDIYKFLCSMMKEDTTNGFSYRYYLINNSLDNMLIIKETKNMILNGTTGLRTWEAALILSDWVICNKQTFTNKTVLELGSGVGLTGITVAKHCPVKSIIMTDHHEDVLETINDNVQINFVNLISKQEIDFTLYENDKQQSIGVMKLDWNHIEDIPKHLSPDIILGADIVYDPSNLQSLIRIFKYFDCEIYIASVIRNEETFSKFLSILELSNLRYEILPFTKSVHLDWDENTESCLLRINKYEMKI